MTVSSRLFEAYLDCRTKCWLRSHGEPATRNAYAEWLSERDAAYCRNTLNSILANIPENNRIIAPDISNHQKGTIWRFAIDVSIQMTEFTSHLPAIERRTFGRGRPTQFIPYHFRFANKLAKYDKLRLAFDAFALSETVKRKISHGIILHGDTHTVVTVNLSCLTAEVKKHIKGIVSLLAAGSPPELVLNRHCGQCEFQARCRARATDKDELSLLSGMSHKQRQKLHGKGIFTVTQLSYTFRPRRRPRRFKGKKEKFHHSLRALAIREQKIHAVDLPTQALDGTPVYLDVEGLPDRDFYYLVGARVVTTERVVQHAFWANDKTEEHNIWDDFLHALSSVATPQLVYYGRYESIFLRQMCDPYGVPQEHSILATAFSRAINLLSIIFARIYFPTFSNGLKDIATHLGFKWSGVPSSGMEAILWRHHWETSRDFAAKQALLDYNRQDCEALELVANHVMALHSNKRLSDAVHTSEIKSESPYRFGPIAFAVPEMEIINKVAYWDYQRARIYVKTTTVKRHLQSPKRRHKLPPNAIIDEPPESHCPRCNSNHIYSHGARSKTVIDIRFIKNGIKRWVTRYKIRRQRCQSCGNIFKPSERRWTAAKYGSNLIAYAMYQNIELHLSQRSIDSTIGKLFGVELPAGWTNKMKRAAAISYASTYDKLVKKLCAGKLVHIDETTINCRGIHGYVWVLASFEDVAYFYTPTREGNTVQELLRDFSGVLISDFYSVYDSIECRQQKCLVHLIRDLNSAILDRPFDEALKLIAQQFATLMMSIVKTIERYGLRRRFLRRYCKAVDHFYKELPKNGTDEPTDKLVERIQRNRHKLFTFLEFDNVPWNNNNAEHAVKAFALLRRVIEGVATEEGLRDTLVLLSVCETCKFKGVEFLDFLRSGSRDVDEFAVNGRLKRVGEARI